MNEKRDIICERLQASNEDLVILSKEIQATSDDLRTLNSYTRNLIEISLDPLVTIDLAGKITDLNNAKEKITGYKREEIAGTYFTTYFTDPGKAGAGLEEVMKNGSVRDYSLEIQHRDGHVTPVLYNASVLQNESGQVIGVFAAARDITEQRKTEKKTKDLLDKLNVSEAKLIQSRKMEAVGRLAGGVAHDFNNLLTTIIGNTGLMLMHNHIEDHIRECLEEIKVAGMRAAVLTRQLLAFSRKQTLRLAVLNLNEVAADMNRMIKRLIGDDVKVKTFFESDLLQVKADRGELEQIIMNLAVNAKDAMPHGGELTIETKNAYLDESYASEQGVELKPGHYVILTVSDTGIGMDKETKSHIFEPFFTSKATDLGTGLGLSAVYGIVKQMKGYIWVYSEPVQGTTFKIYLPGVKTAAEPSQKKITSLERFRGPETVLLVEDDKLLWKSLLH